MFKTKDKRFKRDYTNNDIITYLKGVYKIIGKAPTFRDVNKFPGPSPRTIVRRFRYWNDALRKAGIRPLSKQLIRGERTFIRSHWRKMTDIQIAKKLGVNFSVIRYYRMNYNMWKNRKGTARSTFRKRALRLYGDSCECCGLKMCEWHHIVSKSKNPEDWCILCPTCHAVVTRKLVDINSRSDVTTKLIPFVRVLYSNLRFN